MPSNTIKALLLFSGGLDSILAAKILMRQGIKIVAVCFSSSFFDCSKAEESSQTLGISLRTICMTEDIFELVKNPPHGYGKNMNPCLDCHSLMLKKAALIMRQEKFDILATGEVLGQRSFSRNKSVLKKIEKIAGAEVLRPLSAKLLPITIYERNGLVKRGLLKSISGRRREKQLELAKNFRIKEYPAPAGGCLLTDPEFSERLLKLLSYFPKAGINDVEILKQGRIYWLNMRNGNQSKKVPAVIGRKNEENEKLKKIAKRGDFMVELKEISGPSTLLRFFDGRDRFTEEKNNYKLKIPLILSLGKLELNKNKSFKEIIDIASLLTGWHCVKARGQEVELKINRI